MLYSFLKKACNWHDFWLLHTFILKMSCCHFLLQHPQHLSPPTPLPPHHNHHHHHTISWQQPRGFLSMVSPSGHKKELVYLRSFSCALFYFPLLGFFWQNIITSFKSSFTGHPILPYIIFFIPVHSPALTSYLLFLSVSEGRSLPNSSFILPAEKSA